jgi:hypothetical protein
MKTFFDMACGFLMIPALLGLMGLWVWAMIAWNVSKLDFSVGAASGFVVLIAGLAIAVKLAP